MKKHRRLLQLTCKLLMGHDMRTVDKFADDFAKYREGTSNLHPALQSAFKRFYDHFPVAFKHRKLIERNHQLRTGVYGDMLLSIIQNLEPKKYWTDYYYQSPPSEGFHFTLVPEPNSKTLH